MTALALRGLAARRVRSALTAIAVLLGVAMIAGTYVQTDQIRSAFRDIEQTANAGIDVVIAPRQAFSGPFAARDTVAASVLEQVRRVPGVDRVQGVLQESGSLVVGGDVVAASSAPTIVVSRLDGSFDPFRVAEGRLPRGRGEVAVDAELARDHGLHPGARVGLTTRRGVVPVRLVGVVRYGDVASIGGAQLVVGTLADLQRWYDRAGRVSEIEVAAAGGVAPATLAGRLRAALPSGLTVKTGTQDAADDADATGDAIGGFLTPALLVLAGASLLVGAFIIFNTFSITVAQRTRELALLRAIGATRRQVLAAIGLEALVIGVLGSLAGLAAGLGVARLIGALFDAAGWGIPRGHVELAPRTVVIALGVGIGVTLLAALVPALRATRVAPVAALRTVPPVPRAAGRRRTVLCACMLTAGAALVARGLYADLTATSRLQALGAGTVLVFVGVAVAARVLVRPLATVVGWPLSRLTPTVGQLARENTAGNAARTATTAGALMVGLGLVVFVAVFAHGMKQSFSGSIERLFAADLIVSNDQAVPIPAAIARRVAAVPGVQATCAQYFDSVEVDGHGSSPLVDILNGTDPAAFGRMYRPDWVDGTAADLRRLGAGTTIVEEQFALAHHLRVGSQLSVRGPTGRRVRLTVLAIYRDPLIVQGLLVDRATFAAISAATDPSGVFVRLRPGADAAAVQAAVGRALRAFPTAKVRNLEQYRAYIDEQFDRIVYLLYALLAMSVLISLFGIANSLLLTVHERTRELGVLRALGATGGQVRLLVRAESVITSVIGGLLGTVIGLVFAYFATVALDDWGLRYSVPPVQLLLFLAIAVGAGVLAAAVPARRASRVDIVRALVGGRA